MICDKIDVVNKASPYLIKFVARIVTVLSFICWCVIFAEFLNSFYLYPAQIVHPLCNAIIIFSTHIPKEIHFATGSALDTIPYNVSIMANNFGELHRFKTMAI